MLAAGLRAAEELHVAFPDPSDKKALEMGVSRRVKNMKQLLEHIGPDDDQPAPGTDPEQQPPQQQQQPNDENQPPSGTAAPGDGGGDGGHVAGVDRGANRRGRAGRKRKSPLEAAEATRQKKQYKGSRCWQDYRAAVVAALKQAVERMQEEDMSVRAAALYAQELLLKEDIDVTERHLMRKINETIKKGEVIPPEKPGGVFVPWELELRVAAVVRILRQRRLPVFPCDIIAWAGDVVRDTPYAASFKNGNVSKGWYQRFLKRHGFVTGTERPLEMTRAQWLTEENLEEYYKVAADILVQAGVAVRNPDYDPAVPRSQPVNIIHPERIFSFDETRMELDSTKGGKRKSDHIVRDGHEDRGEGLVTKSSATATAACGRTGTGEALPPYIVFSSGSTFSAGWTRTGLQTEVNGKSLQWRFNHNDKGSLNEDGVVDYVESVLKKAAHMVKPRSETPGQQAVVICDGVGTHLGLEVIESCIAHGIEIALRVPNLSFRLQGEDTVNFGPLKVRMCMHG